MFHRTLLIAIAAAAAIAPELAAAPSPLTTIRVASGLNQPLFVTSPANDSRMFIVEKGGAIKIFSGGSVSATPFLNLGSTGLNLIDQSGERGLLGLAFDPNFAGNGQLYVDYIDRVSLNTVVARYTVSPTDVNLVNTASALTILTVPQPAGRSNHKAGWIGFRPGEGANLYIATGDGGSANDPENRAQNLSDNLGKILRVNVANSTPANPYAIPAGNPFAGATPGNDEIWTYGLRNPFRNSFDRVTGDFWIGDVGQDTREEIDFEAPGAAGRNYGWRAREGFADNPGVGDAAPSNAQNPIFDYANPPTASAAITGGYVYRGSDIPDLVGTYFFADYEMSKTFSLKYNGSAVTDFVDRTSELFNPFGANNIASFGEDYRGELYMLDLNGGEMFKIVPEPSALSSLLGVAILFRRYVRPLAASRTRDTMHR